MIAALMLYGLLVTALAWAGARALEEAARLAGLPTRVGWAIAFVVAAGLVAWAPARVSMDPLAPLALPLTDRAGAIVPAQTPAAEPGVLGFHAINTALRSVWPLGSGASGAAIGGAWAVLSAVLIAAGALTVLRAKRQREGWPRAIVAGETVRIAPSSGPAVVGLLRPEIVLPRRLIAAPDADRHLAVLHEREHVRAGDPWLLAFGYLVVALLPWSPFVWWMHRRLRLAVELDCDRRVLRRGVLRRVYGSFLIDSVGALSDALPGAAFAATPSTLERRLTAMTRPLPRYARSRAIIVGLLGAGAVLAACESRLPTSAEIDAMDASAAGSALEEIGLAEQAGATEYYLDGVRVPEEEARGIPASEIERIEVVRRGAADGASQIHLQTINGSRVKALDAELVFVDPEAADTALDIEEVEMQDGAAGTIVIRGYGVGEEPDAAATAGMHEVVDAPTFAEAFNGLLVIDGKTVDPARMAGLRPEQIESITVLKGAAAARLYGEPEAANGVIQITTKK